MLNELTLCDGDASGFTYNGKGGGLIAYHAGKTFWPHDPAVGFTMSSENCRFEENSAVEGGAIYAYGKAAVTVTNTAFEKNRATYGGAVLDREGSKFTYQQATFKDDEAVEEGGHLRGLRFARRVYQDVIHWQPCRSSRRSHLRDQPRFPTGVQRGHPRAILLRRQ